jgi:hypothetical protein
MHAVPVTHLLSCGYVLPCYRVPATRRREKAKELVNLSLACHERAGTAFEYIALPLYLCQAEFTRIECEEEISDVKKLRSRYAMMARAHAIGGLQQLGRCVSTAAACTTRVDAPHGTCAAQGLDVRVRHHGD